MAETTLWTNWFFIGGSYSSFTLLRNTTDVPVHAAITWRASTGVIVGSDGDDPPYGLVAYDARTSTSLATAGSVEIGHDGEPQALVGSQTTLSGATGLSFDALMMQRLPW